MQSHVKNEPLTTRPYGSGSTALSRVRIHQVFLDADLRYQLPGLLELCGKHEIDIASKPHGNLVVFVNTAKDMIKVLACNSSTLPVLACYRLPSGSRGQQFDLNIIAEIPKAFMARGSLDVQAAMKNVLEKKLGRLH
jgi:hypothetical protein